MKAGRIVEPNQIEVVALAEPEIGPEDVLIQVRAAGICGTDIHILKGEYPFARFPMVPGHEFSGEVVAVGNAVTRFKPGDRVTADPNIPCNRCENCQRNEPNQCQNLAVIGVTRDGAFAEYVAAPEAVTFPIGDMSFSDAALIEPLACVAWGLQRVQIQAGDRVLIFGAGPMGCLLAQAAAAAGAAQVDVTDVVPGRLAIIAELGVTHTMLADDLPQNAKAFAPQGYDLVIDATGVPAVIQQTMAYTRPRGKIWLFGVAPDRATVPFSPYEIFRKDLAIIGSFAVNRTFPQAIMLLQNGKINLAPLVSHRLPIEEFARGFQLAQHDPGRMKVQFEFS
ncbi:MAG: zinc-dependent alcohol dehydrogenase family protein [Anaerolineales bacterium]|nr:zinc-dependent alcohol dehydrogenase family protein [Anaerolineales bacterium]MCB0016357.1 zinc-dependent alcohol dehydrogenase family protein [Anaerolineales bacterium]MCB0028934.1 zinc-dependent alcohol dehydrogenase family protein [Anaerolineales bacterium]